MTANRTDATLAPGSSKYDQLVAQLEAGAVDAIYFDVDRQKIDSLFFSRTFAAGYGDAKYPDKWLYVLTELAKYEPINFPVEFLYIDLATKVFSRRVKSDPARYGKLLAIAMDQLGPASFRLLLIRSMAKYKCIVAAILTMDESKRRIIIMELITIGIKSYHSLLLHGLKEIDTEYFNLVISRLNPEEQQAVARYLSVQDEQDRKYFTKCMNDFAFERGNISYQGGLLTCAQIRARKTSYHFNPVVLNQKHEFKKFLKAIKRHNMPVTEKFIVTGGHWIAGEIKINVNGRADLLLMDPCGAGDRPVLTYIVRKFPRIFPNFRMYLAEEKRQHDFSSCQTFALDDIQHLFTIARYLAADNKPTSIFDYIEAQQKPETTVFDWKDKVSLVRLPLPFMRTMQSKDLLNRIIPCWPAKELANPVNKKGKLTLDHAQTFFRPDPDKANKASNMRIKDKFDAMAAKNVNFLMGTDKVEIEQIKQEFTLQNFEIRLKNQALTNNMNEAASMTLRCSNRDD